MDYKPQEIEKKWRKYWQDNNTYKVNNESNKPKYYVLDMFPYPSGSGLHVGHPLGYIASDIYARYKRQKGFNVLHPMGYDSFGLPAEQYAVQIGVHPAESTATNIKRYREQLDNIGLSFDWSREVRTSEPKYYKWTQWIFGQLFEHYYDNTANKAQSIKQLITLFEKEGSKGVEAANNQEDDFTAAEWNAMTPKQKDEVLMNYRLMYRKVMYVNWCKELKTVLANDEVKDGVSERGGHPVVKKPMLQWSLRTTAYAGRLLDDLEKLDWSDALKNQQRNWIGRSEGAQVFFNIEGSDKQIEIFTTRPDTIFGATYMVLAPEHDFVAEITTPAQENEVSAYLKYVESRSERDRQSDVKTVTGVFTGTYAINPLNGKKVPIWLGEYVLKDYGTGAIMAVPSDDERDQKFAEKFGLEIIQVIDKSDYPNATLSDKVGKMINSDFVNGMEVKDAIQAVISKLESMNIGTRHINYKLRDANYSRQRYWGEPFPITYDADGVAHLEELPVELPVLKDFKPDEDGRSPLAKLDSWVNIEHGTRETDTMPGFAGSSWYFLRYMDPNNAEAFASKKALDYWQDVDLYIGGTEHAVGHLLYSRTWHKFLYDLGYVPTNEPFKRLVNQGLIQGRSSFVYRANEQFAEAFFEQLLKDNNIEYGKNFPVGGVMMDFVIESAKLVIELKDARSLKKLIAEREACIEKEGYKFLAIPLEGCAIGIDAVIKKVKAAINGEVDNIIREDYVDAPIFISKDVLKNPQWGTALHVDVNMVRNDVLDVEAFKAWRPDYKNAKFLLNEEGKYICGSAVEKMSKSKYNVVNPDDIVNTYGADTLRLFEMFLGPIEQSKPWNTDSIEGVSKFLKKFWGLFADGISNDAPTKAELKILHTAIKKVNEDIVRFSYNTCISGMMVAVNDLRKIKCNKAAILKELTILIAPFAPHMAEELWHQLGETTTVTEAPYPVHDEAHLKESSFEYPVCINGKKRALVSLDAGMSKGDIETAAKKEVIKWTEGKTIRKIIVVPKRMVNIVVK